MRFSAAGSRRASAVVVGCVALTAAAVAAARTPYPPRNAGAGIERNAGRGSGAGVAFQLRYSIATYGPIGGNYVIYLTDKPLPCARTYLATPPYLTVSIVTAGSPLVVGKPSLQRPDAEFVAISGMENFLPADSAKVDLAITVDRLLNQLAAIKPEWCDLVEVKYFLGLTDEEAAEVLGIKLRSMQRMWRDARQWLFEQAESGHGKQSAGR